MTFPLLNNQSLEKFIQKVKIKSEEKEFLLSKLPEMDLEERVALFKTLIEIYLLDLEEKETIERLKRFWEK